MGDTPTSKYWDHNEACWVRFDAPPADDQVSVPEQAAPQRETPVATTQEADVRSG